MRQLLLLVQLFFFKKFRQFIMKSFLLIDIYLQIFCISGMQNTTMYTTYNLFALNICDVCASHQCPNCPTINDTKQGHDQIGTTLSASTMEPTTKQTGNAVSGSGRLTSYFNYQLLATLLSVAFCIMLAF